MIEISRSQSDFLNTLDLLDFDSTNPFMSKEYFKLYCAFFAKKNKKLFIFVKEKGKIIGVLPLYKDKLTYNIIGHRASNYLGYLCKEEDIYYVHQEVSNYLSTKKKSIVINYYDINNYLSPLYDIFEKNKRAKKIYLYPCPYTVFVPNFDDFLKKHIQSSKKRTEIKKFRKKMDLFGNVELINIYNEYSYEKYKNLIPQIFPIHKKRFARVYIPKEHSLHENETYYSSLLEKMVKNEKAILSLLVINGEVISFIYMLVYGKVIVDWMPGFNPVFSKFNVGNVHLMEFFNWCCASEKYEIFDFSKGDGAYKDRWIDGLSHNYSFIVRFSNRLVPYLKQSLSTLFFSIKSFLRKKGFINKLKHGILSPKSQVLDENVYQYCCTSKLMDLPILKFEDLHLFNEADQKTIIDYFYQEKTLFCDNSSHKIYVKEDENNV